MTAEESERMKHLCEQIKDEKNAKRFDELVRELNDLLEAKHPQIDRGH